MGFPIAAGISVFIGLILICAGSWVYTSFPRIFQSKLDETLVIREDSPLFEMWVEPTVPVYMQFYFYNIVNAENFSVGNDDVPQVVQLGPYTYRERLKKINLTFSEDRRIVSYQLRKSFHFIPEKSAGFENDTIVIPNIPLITAARKAEGTFIGQSARKGLWNGMVKRDKSTGKPFVQTNVHEVIFDGYVDKLMINVEKKTKIETLPDGRFAFLYKLNNSGSFYSVRTGIDNLSKMGAVIAWNETASDIKNITREAYGRLRYWNDTYCDAINGTDGNQFPPRVSKNKPLRLFPVDVCRSIYLMYEKNTEVKGIPVYRFSMSDELFANPSVNPDNHCFAPKELGSIKEDTSNLSGLLDMRSCKKGAPIVLSLPHFYKAVFPLPDYGFEPPTKEFDTFLDIEPTTGLMVRGVKKLQINVLMEKMTDTYAFRDIRPKMTLIPVFFLNESVEITDEKADMLKSKIILLPKILNISSLVAIATGAIIILITLQFVIIVSIRKSNSKQKLKTKPIPQLPPSHYVRLPARKQSTDCLMNDTVTSEI